MWYHHHYHSFLEPVEYHYSWETGTNNVVVTSVSVCRLRSVRGRGRERGRTVSVSNVSGFGTVGVAGLARISLSIKKNRLI